MSISPEELFDMDYWDTHFECDHCSGNFHIDTVVRVRRMNYFPAYYCQECGLDSTNPLGVHFTYYPLTLRSNT
jgi:predicted RNA-binding Zn-ribbon protein involved in translation (DUF1610 family)